MNTLVAHRVVRREEEEALVGKFADGTYGLVRDSTRVLRRDGTLLAVLLKSAIPRTHGSSMYNAIKERIGESKNRGRTTGTKVSKRMRSDGSRGNTNEAPSVNSTILGFYGRYPRYPYCRQTAFLVNHPRAYAACLPALRAASGLFSEHAPEAYARQHAKSQATHPDFVIPGTCFTTITLNKNFRTACHRDAGDLPEGFGVMTYYRSGSFTGGHLALPAYGIALVLDSYDVVLFDPHEVHGNTPIKPLSKAYERITCVHYYRENMHFCGSAAQELELARRHDARQGSRDMKHRF